MAASTIISYKLANVFFVRNYQTRSEKRSVPPLDFRRRRFLPPSESELQKRVFFFFFFSARTGTKIGTSDKQN